MFRESDWKQVLSGVRGMEWHILVLALAAVSFAVLLSAARWKLLLTNESVSITRLFLVREMGQTLNNVSPIRVVGDAAQTLMLTHGNGIKAPKVVSSLFMGRLFDFLVTITLVGGGLFVLPQLSGLKPIVVPLWVMTAVGMAAFFLFGRCLHGLTVVHRVRPLEELLRAIGAVRTDPAILVACLVLTTARWMSIGVTAWLVAQTAGVDLPFWLISIVIVAVSLFDGAIVATPGLVGAYEFVAVSTLGVFAVDPTVAPAFTMVIHVILFLPTLVVVLPVIAFEHRTLKSAWVAAGGAVQRLQKGSHEGHVGRRVENGL